MSINYFTIAILFSESAVYILFQELYSNSTYYDGKVNFSVALAGDINHIFVFL